MGPTRSYVSMGGVLPPDRRPERALGRDVNAAVNVQRRGQRLRGGLNVQLEDPRSPYLAVCGR